MSFLNEVLYACICTHTYIPTYSSSFDTSDSAPSSYLPTYLHTYLEGGMGGRDGMVQSFHGGIMHDIQGAL